MTSPFTVTTWNFQRMGHIGRFTYPDGRPPLTTPLVLNTLERVVRGADVIQEVGGLFAMQESWCGRAADELANLVKGTHPYIACPSQRSGDGVDGVGHAVRRRINSLSGELARVSLQSSDTVAHFLQKRFLPDFLASRIKELGRGMAGFVLSLGADAIRELEDVVPDLIGLIGGADVGHQSSPSERAIQLFLDEHLLARAVMAVFDPDLRVFGEGVELISPDPITRHHFTPHSIKSGLELLANKGFLEGEIQVQNIGTVVILNTHLNDGKTRRAVATRRVQVLTILRRAQELIRAGHQVIIAGDFNIRAEDEKGRRTEEFQWLLDQINATGMREVYQSLWSDNYREKPPHTYDPNIPILPERLHRERRNGNPMSAKIQGRARFDFIFIGPGLKADEVRVLRDEITIEEPGMGPYLLSDHYPVCVRIQAG